MLCGLVRHASASCSGPSRGMPAQAGRRASGSSIGQPVRLRFGILADGLGSAKCLFRCAKLGDEGGLGVRLPLRLSVRQCVRQCGQQLARHRRTTAVCNHTFCLWSRGAAQLLHWRVNRDKDLARAAPQSGSATEQVLDSARFGATGLARRQSWRTRVLQQAYGNRRMATGVWQQRMAWQQAGSPQEAVGQTRRLATCSRAALVACERRLFGISSGAQPPMHARSRNAAIGLRSGGGATGE